MGKLLSGRYGALPDAQSETLTLRECNQKLGLTPSDFVSVGEPKFFKKAFGAGGRYLLFLLEADEIKDSAVWKPGYYLLPIEAKNVLAALGRHKGDKPNQGAVLPIEWDDEDQAPAAVKERAMRWAAASQPLFFKCTCQNLELRLYSPWAIRRRWKARLRCPNRCQPPLMKLL